jgi:hypothetical protein
MEMHFSLSKIVVKVFKFNFCLFLVGATTGTALLLPYPLRKSEGEMP